MCSNTEKNVEVENDQEDPFDAGSDIDPDYIPPQDENINETSAEETENAEQPAIKRIKEKNQHTKSR